MAPAGPDGQPGAVTQSVDWLGKPTDLVQVDLMLLRHMDLPEKSSAFLSKRDFGFPLGRVLFSNVENRYYYARMDGLLFFSWAFYWLRARLANGFRAVAYALYPLKY